MIDEELYYYYKCPRCGFVTFILSRITCINCGRPFVVIDKRGFYMKHQTRLDDYNDNRFEDMQAGA